MMLEALLAAGEVRVKNTSLQIPLCNSITFEMFSTFRSLIVSYSKKLKDLYFFRKFVPRPSNTCTPRAPAVIPCLPSCTVIFLPSPTRLPCPASHGRPQMLSLDSQQKIRIWEWWRATHCSLLRALTVLCGVRTTKGSLSFLDSVFCFLLPLCGVWSMQSLKGRPPVVGLNAVLLSS